jgi:hypothetical protein
VRPPPWLRAPRPPRPRAYGVCGFGLLGVAGVIAIEVWGGDDGLSIRRPIILSHKYNKAGEVVARRPSEEAGGVHQACA